MSNFNGSGTFVISGAGLPYVVDTIIDETVANQLNTDLATGLSTCITKDGQTTTTQRIPFAMGASFAQPIIYGGVTLANAVTGTGSMVLSNGPAFTGGVNVTGLGTFTCAGDITCVNGSIHSGNDVTATGFGITNTMSFEGNALSGAAGNYQIIANSGGVQLNSGAGSWSAISDERRKADLVPIVGALEKLKTWRTVIGRYTDDQLKQRHPFLIAQDVQPTTPEAVSEKDDGTLMLSYTDTIPDIVAAIKELCARVEALGG